MEDVRKFIQREPLATANISAATVSALLWAIVEFSIAMGWIDLSVTQQESFQQLLILVVPIIFMVFNLNVRSKVTPMAAPFTNDGQPAQIVPAQNE